MTPINEAQPLAGLAAIHSVNCCQCNPVVCGVHVIKPCGIAAIRQVSPTGKKKRFIVEFNNPISGTIFLDEDQLLPLLDHWGIDAEDIALAPSTIVRDKAK